jgi:hypothetical protein
MLRALVEGNVGAAPADIALAFRYGDAVARGIPAQEWRDQLRARWGEKGLIELAFTIATARFYPAVKRGMGYAQACERVMVGDQATQAVRAA